LLEFVANVTLAAAVIVAAVVSVTAAPVAAATVARASAVTPLMPLARMPAAVVLSPDLSVRITVGICLRLIRVAAEVADPTSHLGDVAVEDRVPPAVKGDGVLDPAQHGQQPQFGFE
jgi:hypothetical protein